MKTQPIEATETSHSENLDTYQTFLSFMHTPEDVTGEDKRGRRNRLVLIAIAFFLYFQKMLKQHECGVNTSCTGSNEK